MSQLCFLNIKAFNYLGSNGRCALLSSFVATLAFGQLYISVLDVFFLRCVCELCTHYDNSMILTYTGHERTESKRLLFNQKHL